MMFETTLEAATPVYSIFRSEADYEELLEMYVAELADKPATLRELGRKQDFETVRREAHKLRGSAGGYGFEGLSALAGRLEQSCKSSDPKADAILQEIEELVDYLGRVRV